MRTINKNFRRPPLILNTNNLSDVIDVTNANHKDQIRQTIYGDKSVVNKLLAIYHHKCAYCESYEPEPEVEHYRPKKRVTGEVHHGYYWLCYEWSNLLPACHDCNKQRSKGNHFPVEGSRMISPVFNGAVIDLAENLLTSRSLDTNEVPLLLNPEYPGFSPFFFFKINSNGEFEPLQGFGTLNYRKAETTIKTMRLNRDKLLLGVRKRAIRRFMMRLKIIVYKYLNSANTEADYEDEFLQLLKEINQNSNPNIHTNEYSFFWAYFLKNFKYFITCYFKGRVRIGLHNTYDLLVTRL